MQTKHIITALYFRIFVWPLVLVKQFYELLLIHDAVTMQLMRITLGKIFLNKGVALPIYELIEKYSRNGNRLQFTGFSMPLMGADEDKKLFFHEFSKLVAPYDEFWKKYKWGIIAFFGSEGGYEAGEVKFGSGDVIIDAGANVGIFSASASRTGARVYAFEPIPEAYAYLEQAARLNAGIEPVCKALGSEKGILRFAYSPNKELAASSCVLDLNSDDYIEVQATSLDEWAEENGIRKIDFLKADIEGAERFMLQGARRVLKKMAPKLSICIYHLPDDKEVLTKLVLEANSDYVLSYNKHKMFGYVK
ncbi:FkbM family methyltransferase [Maridesulfovibrio sp. FT414]|uniref:FkbM family methyltransferase n=1 Tax=Maridesulfovibrio sp. FT414 TaxID=2979469 RepID=UPI003D8057E7